MTRHKGYRSRGHGLLSLSLLMGAIAIFAVSAQVTHAEWQVSGRIEGVSAISVGIPVIWQGVSIGRVIAVMPDAMGDGCWVVLAFQGIYRSRIPADGVLYYEGGVQPRLYLEIFDPAAPPLQPGAVLPGRSLTARALEQAWLHQVRQWQEQLGKWNRAFRQWSRSGQVEADVARLRTTFQRWYPRRVEIGACASEIERRWIYSVIRHLRELQSHLQAEGFPQAVQNLDAMLSDMERLWRFQACSIQPLRQAS